MTHPRRRVPDRPVLQPLWTHPQELPRDEQLLPVGGDQVRPPLSSQEKGVQPLASPKGMEHAVAPQTKRAELHLSHNPSLQLILQ